jgi:hypothetical protein
LNVFPLIVAPLADPSRVPQYKPLLLLSSKSVFITDVLFDHAFIFIQSFHQNFISHQFTTKLLLVIISSAVELAHSKARLLMLI